MFKVESDVRFGLFSAGHDHKAWQSKPIPMAGQAEAKQMGKSVRFPIRHPADKPTVQPPTKRQDS